MGKIQKEIKRFYLDLMSSGEFSNIQDKGERKLARKMKADLEKEYVSYLLENRISPRYYLGQKDYVSSFYKRKFLDSQSLTYIDSKCIVTKFVFFDDYKENTPLHILSESKKEGLYFIGREEKGQFIFNIVNCIKEKDDFFYFCNDGHNIYSEFEDGEEKSEDVYIISKLDGFICNLYSDELIKNHCKESSK